MIFCCVGKRQAKVRPLRYTPHLYYVLTIHGFTDDMVLFVLQTSFRIVKYELNQSRIIALIYLTRMTKSPVSLSKA